MQIVETVELISINGTLIFQLISFLIFLVLINRIMVRPLRAQAGERQAHLDLVSQDIATAEATCEDLDRQVKVQEAQVRQEAAAVRDDMEAAGKQVAETLIQAAREEINELKSQAQKDNAGRIAAIRAELDAEAKTVAHHMMASILGRGIES